jgi:hypothetical protein
MPGDAAGLSGSGGSGSAGWVVYDACEFLRKRKFDVPGALAAAARAPSADVDVTEIDGESKQAAAEELEWVLKHTGGLKERHRRALVRFVEQASRKRQAPPQTAVVHSESDDEVDVDAHTPPPVRGGRWPQGVVYSNNYRWDKTVPLALAALYQPTAGPARQRPARPSPRCFGARIVDPDHPAHKQNGLYAAVDMECGTWVLDYGGDVRLKSDDDAASEYACEFGDKGELTLDSTLWGTEARFINDYRNTGSAQVLVEANARTACVSCFDPCFWSAHMTSA